MRLSNGGWRARLRPSRGILSNGGWRARLRPSRGIRLGRSLALHKPDTVIGHAYQSASETALWSPRSNALREAPSQQEGLGPEDRGKTCLPRRFAGSIMTPMTKGDAAMKTLRIFAALGAVALMVGVAYVCQEKEPT